MCGNFGCNEAQIEKPSRYAQFQARPQDCPERCACDTEKPRCGIRVAYSADEVGEIYFRDFPAADLWCSDPDIFYCLRARDCDAAIVDGRGILVLLVRRGALVDRLLRSAAPSLNLRVRARAYSRAVGLVDGRPCQQISRRHRRRTCSDDQGQLLDRAGTLFFPNL